MPEKSGDFYLAGGRMFFTAHNAAEEEIGEVSDVTITPNIETAEALTRRNGAATVAKKITKRKDYKLAFTTQTVSGENLARFFNGQINSTDALTAGSLDPDTGEILSNFDEHESYKEDDRVLYDGFLWRCINDTYANSGFDEMNFSKIRSTKGSTVIAAGEIEEIVGSVRFEGFPVTGKRLIVEIPQVSLAANGGFSLIGDDFANLVFDGAIEKQSGKPIFTITTEEV